MYVIDCFVECSDNSNANAGWLELELFVQSSTIVVGYSS